MSDWRVVWKQIGEGSALSEQLRIPEGGWLPFFLAGDELVELDDGDHVPLKHRNLLWGMLVGYHDRSPEFDADRSRELFPDLLDHLLDVFRAPSHEVLLADAVAAIRAAHGDDAADKAAVGAAALRRR
jgi:hypothetical protein